MTYCLATVPRDWHCTVRYDPSRSSKVNDFHTQHPISAISGRISHRFIDMASFLLKTHIFPPPSFNPQFENVPLGVDG